MQDRRTVGSTKIVPVSRSESDSSRIVGPSAIGFFTTIRGPPEQFISDLPSIVAWTIRSKRARRDHTRVGNMFVLDAAVIGGGSASRFILGARFYDEVVTDRTANRMASPFAPRRSNSQGSCLESPVDDDVAIDIQSSTIVPKRDRPRASTGGLNAPRNQRCQRITHCLPTSRRCRRCSLNPSRVSSCPWLRHPPPVWVGRCKTGNARSGSLRRKRFFPAVRKPLGPLTCPLQTFMATRL